MDMVALRASLKVFKNAFEHAILTGEFGGNSYDNGAKAKEALIRSQRLIMKIHERFKQDIVDMSLSLGRNIVPYPAIGQTSPELKFTGLLKAKDQDLVFLFDDDGLTPETVNEGMRIGEIDQVGKEIAERSLVVGIRSSLSSVSNNFDTHMERLFGEAVNLRQRLPELVMGEVFLIPVYEYLPGPMINNQVEFSMRPVNISKWIKTLKMFSGDRDVDNTKQTHIYERTCLLLVDFRQNPPYLYTSKEELIIDGLLDRHSDVDFDSLSPLNFDLDILEIHRDRHEPPGWW